MDSDPVTMSYSKNGEDLGVCFEVEKEKLEDKALFPHLLTKNTEFECNFGQRVNICLSVFLSFLVRLDFYFLVNKY